MSQTTLGLDIIAALLCVAGAIIWHGNIQVIRQGDRSMMIFDRLDNSMRWCTHNGCQERERIRLLE